MTDITELAQIHELRNKVNRRLYDALGFQGTSGEHAKISLSIDECKSVIAAFDERLALVEALEKSEKTSEARREAIDTTHKRAARERDRANAAEEALEKAQQLITELEQQHCGGALMEREIEHSEVIGRLISEIDIRDIRIAELEPISTAAEKLVRCKGRYHSEHNYRALAALFGVTTPDLPPIDGESRTVKLPVGYTASLGHPFSEAERTVMIPGGGDWLNLVDVEHVLTAAGIKWEAE